MTGVRIHYKVCRITWKKVHGNHFVIKTPVPYGMTGLVAKLRSASYRSWEGLPCHSESISNWRKGQILVQRFTVEVSFSGKYYAYVFLFQLLTLLKHKVEWDGCWYVRVVFYMDNVSCIKIQHVTMIISCFSEFP